MPNPRDRDVTGVSAGQSTALVAGSTREVGVRTFGLTATHARVLALVAVLAISLAIRLVDLNQIGYNSDEAVYAGQGAAIAQVPVITDLFPVFRAHPLLFQFSLAVLYNIFGMHDMVGRVASALIGVATVYLTFLLGRRLYGWNAGLIAALLLAVMPYHVVPTRQVLLDGSMTLMSTLALYSLARFADSERPIWIYAAGVSMGLTFLAKETGILLVGSIYAFLALSPEVRVRIRDLIVSLGLMAITMSPHFLAASLAGGGSGTKTGQYLVWQLFRRPNHTWEFYLTVVPPAVGIGVLVVAALGFWTLRHEFGWREKLMLMWIAVPVAFFQLWPTKGFQYLLPAAVPVVVLAGRTLAHWPLRPIEWRGFVIQRWWVTSAVALLLAASLIGPTWRAIHPNEADTFLAGSGGVPGGRELGDWIQENLPYDAQFMTVGPSMANIVRYYGHREAYGLSVSPNPLHRNPSYEPILNPDYQIRTAELQYLVWDSFSAARSPFFSDAIRYYVRKYGGRVLHTEFVNVTTQTGARIEKPVIILYEVHPQW